jgi:beta-galactosidase
VLPVICYTNCDSVELFVNGQSYGGQSYALPRAGMDRDLSWGEQFQLMRAQIRPTTADLHLAWTVPYRPGTLKAVGKIKGEVVCVQETVTAGPAAAIELSADRTTIAADGRDVVHLTVRILDADGHPVPDADDPVTFEVSGQGRLIGADNGDPLSHEPFQSNVRHAFHGLCLAIVQSTGQPGLIEVTASAPGLAAATAQIDAVESQGGGT